MEHSLTVSLDEFDAVYSDVDWYSHDDDEMYSLARNDERETEGESE